MLSDEGIVILEDEINKIFISHNDIIRIKFAYVKSAVDGIITYGILPFEYLDEIKEIVDKEGLQIDGFYSSGNDLHMTMVDNGGMYE